MRYDEGCLAAHSLNLIGDRWAMLVLRELMFGPKRFKLIRDGVPGITASVLATRLSQLTDGGAVDHDARQGLYQLTCAGKATLPVLEALCRMALHVPGHDPRRFISPSALMISMGVMLRRDLPQGEHAVAGFDFGAECFDLRVADGMAQARAVRQCAAPVVLSGTGNEMAAAVYGARPLSQLVAEGTLRISGDVGAAQAFVDRFRLQ